MCGSVRLMMVTCCLCFLVPIFPDVADCQVSSTKSKFNTANDRFERYVDGLMRQYDKNKDSRLSKDELDKMRRPPKGVDTDLDGFVSKTEYLEYYKERSRSVGSRLKTVQSTESAPEELKEESPNDSATNPTIIFLRHEDAETMQNLAYSFLGKNRVRIHRNERLNALVVRADEKSMSLLTKLVEEIDREPPFKVSEAKSKRRARAVAGLLGGGGGAISGNALGGLLGNAVSSKSKSKSKETKPSVKGDAAVWLLKVVRPAANKNVLLDQLNKSAFDKLPETINSQVVDGEISVMDQVTTVVSNKNESRVSHGATKPIVTGTSTGRGGPRSQSIRNAEEGVSVTLTPLMSNKAPEVLVEFSKTIHQAVESQGDLELNSRVNFNISNAVPFKDDGATAMLSSSDGQTWILVVGTKRAE